MTADIQTTLTPTDLNDRTPHTPHGHARLVKPPTGHFPAHPNSKCWNHLAWEHALAARTNRKPAAQKHVQSQDETLAPEQALGRHERWPNAAAFVHSLLPPSFLQILPIAIILGDLALFFRLIRYNLRIVTDIAIVGPRTLVTAEA